MAVESEGQFSVTRETWCQMYPNGPSRLGKPGAGGGQKFPPKHFRRWKGCGHGLPSTEIVNREMKGSGSSVVNSGGFRTRASSLLGLTWSPYFLHQESSGICTSLKEGALRRGGSLSPVPMAIRLAGMLLASIPAERCVLSSPRRQALCLSEQKLPLTPHAPLRRAVGCPSASRSPQPKPRLKRPLCTPPSGKRPKESDRRLPWEARESAFPQTPHQVPFYSLLPHLTRREPVKSLSGKEREAALAFGETEKQVGLEGVAELPGQPEVGHWARRKHRRLVLLSGRLP